MNFAYTGRSSEGAVNGVLEGASAGAVADALVARGVTPLTIKQTADGPRPAPAQPPRFDLNRWMQPRVTPVDLLLFSRQLHTLLKAGVPILRALAGLQESAASEHMKQTLQQVRQSLGSGLDLSMSLAQNGEVFDSFYVALVRGKVSRMGGLNTHYQALRKFVPEPPRRAARPSPAPRPSATVAGASV